MERALEVHVEHGVHEVRPHVVERLVAQDSRVVDDDVHLAVGIDGGLNDRGAALGRGDRVVVRHSLAASGLDLVDDLLCSRGVLTGAIHRATEVVHHDQCAAPGEQQCVLAAEATTCTSDDCNLAVETDISHLGEFFP